MSLLQTCTVMRLDRAESERDMAIFRVWPDDDNHGHVIEAQVSWRNWQDMGEPTEITVTIEPGDHLNGE